MENFKIEGEIDLTRKIDPAWMWLGSNLNIAPCNSFEAASFKKDIKDALFAEVRALLKDTHQTAPPYNPDIVAELRKVKQILRVRLHHSGLLLPVENGFIMKLSDTIPTARQRFACAHEIGHTFFFNLNIDPPAKPYSKFSSEYWVEEGLCDEIARELLLPEPSIRACIAEHPYPTIASLKKIANLFQVPSEVLARRIQQLDL